MSALYDALHKVQGEAPAIQASAVNPAFKSKYVSLEVLMEEILPLLNTHGLVLMQHPTALDSGMPALRSVIVHAESGEEIADVMPLVLEKPTPQGLASALTYGRRHALMSMLGLVADKDDDGHAASKPKEEPKPPPPPENPPAAEQWKTMSELLAALKEQSPPAEGQRSWDEEAAAYVKDTFSKESASLNTDELDAVIAEFTRRLEVSQIPFGEPSA